MRCECRNPSRVPNNRGSNDGVVCARSRNINARHRLGGRCRSSDRLRTHRSARNAADKPCGDGIALDPKRLRYPYRQRSQHRAAEFGSKLVSEVLRPQLSAIGAWRPGSLATLEYSDRYVNSPLAALLLFKTLAALRNELGKQGDKPRLSLVTWPLKGSRQGYRRQRLWDNWEHEEDRREAIEALAGLAGVQCDFRPNGAAHGRKLVLRCDDGSAATILFDQGFGYWKSSSEHHHDFRSAPVDQAKSIWGANFIVAGQGDSYIAVTTSLAH